MNQDILKNSFSLERLKSYETLCPSGEEHEIIGAYHWNLLICQALYPFLQSAEVALRNNMHQAISTKFQDEDWLNFEVKEQVSRQILEDTRKKLSKKGSNKVDDIVASLTFGFWVNLLKQKTYRDQYNEHRLWPSLVSEVFTRYDTSSGGNDIKQIYKRFEEIKLIRNRLFHHEPVWKFKASSTASGSIAELRKKFRHIYKTIGWMSKSKQEYLKKFGFVDLFYKNCTEEILEQYTSLLKNKQQLKSKDN